MDNHHLTPQLKKKFEDNTPEFKTPAGIPVSSPTTDYETANNTFVGLTTNGTLPPPPPKLPHQTLY